MEFRTMQDRQRTPTVPTGKSRTHQSFKAECDINNLMRRYEKTGILDHVNHVQGRYGDFTVVPDYQTALNRVSQANEMFMMLPARIRAEFQNDPGKFLAFAEDPENEPAMRELGLLPSKKPDSPNPVDGIPEGMPPAEAAKANTGT